MLEALVHTASSATVTVIHGDVVSLALTSDTPGMVIRDAPSHELSWYLRSIESKMGQLLQHEEMIVHSILLNLDSTTA